jgi:excisionase family DNA binding protein
MDVLAVRVGDAARMLGISRARLYPLIMNGDIPSFTLGSSRLVPVDGLRRFIEAQTRTRAACEAGDGTGR